MIKNKPVIGIIPTFDLNKTESPYDEKISFVNMYIDKISESGGIPIGILNDNISDYLDICDGYLWPGGSKIYPEFFKIIEDAITNKKPLLGVCLGMQAISSYFALLESAKNANLSLDELIKNFQNDDPDKFLKKIDNVTFHDHSVTKDEEVIDKARHIISIKKDSLLAKIYQKEKLNVVSLHKFAILKPFENLNVVAKSEDEVIEAVEYTKNNRMILGVQFHPEIENDSKIFDWLINSCYQKNLLLVNKENKIPDDYNPEIVLYKSSYPLCQNDGNIAKDAMYSWLQIRDYIRKKGYYIDVESAYRSTELQTKLFEENKLKYGIEHTLVFVAKPRYSEHETGLAIDICMKYQDKWVNEFDEELKDCYVLLHQICADYGFILRYPEGKESITGYHYEPWHLRFIGSTKIAHEIMDNNLTLEEYYQKNN
mgnify:CR=1 FL=1